MCVSTTEWMSTDGSLTFTNPTVKWGSCCFLLSAVTHWASQVSSGWKLNYTPIPKLTAKNSNREQRFPPTETFQCFFLPSLAIYSRVGQTEADSRMWPNGLSNLAWRAFTINSPKAKVRRLSAWLVAKSFRRPTYSTYPLKRVGPNLIWSAIIHL